LRLALVLVGAVWAPPLAALELALPVDCDLGQSCYIQQYFDHDPSPAWGDFTCGTLAYDGHDGTDFALPSQADMAEGVSVLAAAAGTVKGLRDGVADFVPYVPGQECGNGVLIDHGGGWETQYCHLRQGSVQVQVGQRLDQGAPLGLVGQSGMAEFPHLHLSVRKNGVEIDPFTPMARETCTAAGTSAQRDDLWGPEIPYQPGGIIGAGFATEVPGFQAVKQGLASPPILPAQSPALVLWVYMFGTRAGDAVVVEITGPEGRIIAERAVLEKNQALSFRAMGRKMRGAVCPPGPYTGQARLIRGGAEIGRVAVDLTISP
jgi:hypothetical protein